MDVKTETTASLLEFVARPQPNDKMGSAVYQAAKDELEARESGIWPEASPEIRAMFKQLWCKHVEQCFRCQQAAEGFDEWTLHADCEIEREK